MRLSLRAATALFIAFLAVVLVDMAVVARNR